MKTRHDGQVPTRERNWLRRLDFRTYLIHALACMEDVAVCVQFFGNILAMKYSIL